MTDDLQRKDWWEGESDEQYREEGSKVEITSPQICGKLVLEDTTKEDYLKLLDNVE